MILEIVPPSEVHAEQATNTDSQAYRMRFYSDKAKSHGPVLIVRSRTGTVLDRILVAVDQHGKLHVTRQVAEVTPKADVEAVAGGTQ